MLVHIYYNLAFWISGGIAGHGAWPRVAFDGCSHWDDDFAQWMIAAIQVAIVSVLIPSSQPGGVCFTALVTGVCASCFVVFPYLFCTHCLCFYCQVQTNCLPRSRNWLCDVFKFKFTICLTCLWIQVAYSMSNLIFSCFTCAHLYKKKIMKICELWKSFPHGCCRFSCLKLSCGYMLNW